MFVLYVQPISWSLSELVFIFSQFSSLPLLIILIFLVSLCFLSSSRFVFTYCLLFFPFLIFSLSMIFSFCPTFSYSVIFFQPSLAIFHSVVHIIISIWSTSLPSSYTVPLPPFIRDWVTLVSEVRVFISRGKVFRFRALVIIIV